MSFYYGYVRGNRGTATRCGHKTSGLEVIATSHTSKLEVHYRWNEEEKRTYIEITIRDAQNGKSRLLFYGPEEKLLMDPMAGFTVAGQPARPQAPTSVGEREAAEELEAVAEAHEDGTAVLRGIYMGEEGQPVTSGCRAIRVWFPGGKRGLSLKTLTPMAFAVQKGQLSPKEGVKVFVGDHRQVQNIIDGVKAGTIVNINFRAEWDWELFPVAE